MTWAFGPLFPMFILIFGASVVGLVWLGASVAGDRIADGFGEHFPGRPFAVVSILMAVLLVVQALDLGAVVPTALLISALAWRRTAVGYVLASVYVVTSIAMSAAIVAMLLSAGIVEGTFE